ncbi:hypothetical protein DXG01_017228 [Tephrocybe rancida]|nr:hypothetical protein DXG01_017228 [Tephrocybe rancida]
MKLLLAASACTSLSPISQPAPTPMASLKTWLTAEEEKTQLHKAQVAVLKKAQGLDCMDKATPPIKKQFTAAELYSETMATHNQAMACQ